MLNMSRFPRFFTHRALLLDWNDGSIRAPIITENDGFFISRRYAIIRVSDRCFRCDHRRQKRRFLGSLYSWQSRPTLCICYERQRTATHPPPAQESLFMAIQSQTLYLLRKIKDHNSSTSSTGIFLHSTGCSVSSRGGRSFACSFNQALNVRRETPNVIFLDKRL